jgi:hypothetical protein
MPTKKKNHLTNQIFDQITWLFITSLMSLQNGKIKNLEYQFINHNLARKIIDLYKNEYKFS